MKKNSIFEIRKPTFNPRLRLFCFPYAGGGSSTYLPWLDKLNSSIELVFVQLPGRGRRFTDRLHDSMDTLVEELYSAVDLVTSAPYAFFGHSLGCQVAYEFCCRLKKENKPLPLHFFASGSGAPHLKIKKNDIHSLPEAEFIEELKSLNGTPEEVLENQELLELVLPMLRSDFKLSETHQSKKLPMPFPIDVLNGEDDDIEPSHLSAWSELTLCRFQIQQFPGDHFFIQSNSNLVLEKVENELSTLLSQARVSCSPP